jgi:predicted nucleic acid-binding protein
MTTAVDTNVLIALWNSDESLNFAVRQALDRARTRGELVISAPVYAELFAFPGRTATFMDEFFRDTQIRVDWEFAMQDWREAGRAFQLYTSRRRKSEKGGAPRRILADFLIGSHASRRGYGFLTLDEGIFRSAFSTLKILEI